MAAALMQYQACLGIMVRLQVEDLTRLKCEFDRAGRGLSLQEFVSVMLDHVGWEPGNVVPFVEDLMELFAQVDVNGDGTMEWEEFTSAIIEGGMGTSSDEIEWRDMQYEENTRFADVVNRPPKRITHLPEFRRLLLYENSRPVVELLDPSALYPSENETRGGPTSAASKLLLASADNGTPSTQNSDQLFKPALPIVNKFHPLCYITGYRRDQDDVRSERSPVQALKYLNQVDLIAVSGGDLKLTFWSALILTSTSSGALETPLPLAIVHTPRPQRVLEWNASTKHLYSISADLVITVWKVDREKNSNDVKGTCEVAFVTVLKRHTDLLQDLLVLNTETLLSCGMDNMIHLWDTSSLQVRASRMGHRRGVRLLTKLSDHLFLSAGFECEVYGWEISSLATSPVFKLWGHTAPVCCMQLIQSAAFSSDRRGSTAGRTSRRSSIVDPTATLIADQAITVDDEGWFKWWNLSNVLSTDSDASEKSNNRCLQTFRLGSDKYPWKAHSLVVLNHGQCILAAGLHKLKLLQRVRLKPKVLASSVVLYNSASLTLLTTTDKEIRIWDATTGTLVRTYRNITRTDITCVDVDARQRKIVFGTQNGELIVLNYLNGAILKQWTPHQLHVSALIYCKEDQCVLTASWDRSLRLYDDNASENALLRCITDAHDSDIKCLAYCYALGLVVSGGTGGGMIKIWDYIYFLLEDTCVLPVNLMSAATGNDVNALEFIDPYPLLLSGHESGLICLWDVSPTQPSTLLLCFYPFLDRPSNGMAMPHPSAPSEEDSDDNRTAISCCQVTYDESSGEILAGDITKGRFLLVSANVKGEVCITDISRAIAQSHARAIREESLPSHHHQSYNPRRRFLRQGKNAKRLKQHKDHGEGSSGSVQSQNIGFLRDSDVERIERWRAHHGNIRCLRLVDDPSAILTCGSDKGVKVWSFQGQCLGDLTSAKSGGNASPPKRTTIAKNGSWQWRVDSERMSVFKRQQAEQVWDAMKASKLKQLSSRHQSVVALKRHKRRIPTGMRNCESAPALSNSAALQGDVVAETKSASESGMYPENHQPRQAERLFDQLQGKTTWKQSEFQVARQVAWEKEREKFRVRMKRIMKSKTKTNSGGESKSNTADPYSIGNNQQPPHEQPDATLQDLHEYDPAVQMQASLQPSLEHPVDDLPFEDKDNWQVGSLNRETQMYSHLHQEKVRRQQKIVASSNGLRLRRSASTDIDLAPSEFLLKKLGAACLIDESRKNAPPPQQLLRPVQEPRKLVKKSNPLRSARSQSMGVLPTAATTGLIDPELSMDAAFLTKLVPQHSIQELMQHYDILKSKDVDVQQAARLIGRAVGSKEETGHGSNNDVETSAGSKPAPRRLSASNMRAKRSKDSTASRQQNSRPGAASAPVESSFEKKQRMRSDAALLRRDHFGEYSREDVLNIYRTFHKIDQDQSGSITLRELLDGAGLFAGTHLQDNIMSIFSSIDHDQSGQIDLPELASAVFSDASPANFSEILRLFQLLDAAERAKKAKKKQLSPEQIKEIKALFRVRWYPFNGAALVLLASDCLLSD